MVTKAEFLFMIQSVNLPPSAHTITFSVHCSTLHPLQPKAKHPVHTLQEPIHLQCTHCSSHYIFSAHTAAAITSSVHTSAMYSYLQPIFSAHCSHVYPCTAICSQSSVHTAAIYNHLHCSYSIQCTTILPTLQLFYPVHTAAILSSAHCSFFSFICPFKLSGFFLQIINWYQ